MARARPRRSTWRASPARRRPGCSRSSRASGTSPSSTGAPTSASARRCSSRRCSSTGCCSTRSSGATGGRRAGARDAHPAYAARARRHPGDLRRVRFAVDTGGTFTDLVVEDDERAAAPVQEPDDARRPGRGACSTCSRAAAERGARRAELLGARPSCSSTARRARSTPSSPATTARTAFLTTRGPPGRAALPRGRADRRRSTTRAPYPAPYVPRALTFEVPERIGAHGEVVAAARRGRRRRDRRRGCASSEVEAVGVCLLWSIVNPAHELRVGELLDGAPARASPYTLSHALNPSIREYRRASSTVHRRLAEAGDERRTCAGSSSGCATAGFGGRLLIVTSAGGVLDAARGRRGADPLDRLGPGDGAGRRPLLRPRRRRRRRRRSSPTRAARATTSASCAAAGSRGRARPGSASRSSGT